MAGTTAAAAMSELRRLRELDALGRVDATLLVGPPRPEPTVIVVTVAAPAPAAAPEPAPAPPKLTAMRSAQTDFDLDAAGPAAGDAAGAGARSTRAGASATAATATDDDADDDDLPARESAAGEVKRLEATLHELTNTNDRIMAQNIALLADLEVAQKAVRELRAEKDALATQIKRLLTQPAIASAIAAASTATPSAGAGPAAAPEGGR